MMVIEIGRNLAVVLCILGTLGFVAIVAVAPARRK